MKAFHILLALAAVCYYSTGTLTAEETIRIRADSWAPYNIEPGTDKPGWGIEIAEAIFSKHGIKIDYQTLPWTRAVSMLESGEIECAIGATKDDIPTAIFPALGFAEARSHFFVLKDSKWEYKDESSLDSITLGVIQDYAYTELLDKRIAENKNVFISTGETPLDQLITMLEKGRVDALVEDPAVFKYKLKELGKKSETFKEIPYDNPNPIYLAFTPKNKEVSEKYAKLFDEGMAELRSSGKLKEILAKYGAEDWKK